MLVETQDTECQNQTILLPKSYYKNEILENEIQFLFSDTWQWVCFYRDISNKDDYVTVDYFGQSVVIKNFDGETKAFLNVCSHRFSRICKNKKGNGLLQCPYHSWTYNKEGYPYAIPLRKTFENLNIEDLKLVSFRVAVCGEFVFIKKNNTGSDLPDFLGSNYQLLELISKSLGDLIDTNSVEIDANWKIVVENTLEEYHVRKIHSQSIGLMGLGDQEYCFDGAHSLAKMSVKNKLENNAKLSKIFSERKFKIDGYHHYFIFPNLTLATTYGTTFSIQSIIPMKANKTLFTSYVFGTSLGDCKSSLQKAYENTVKDLNRKIFYEDKLICEEVQKGIEITEKNFSPLCKQEKRIYAFQKSCCRYLKYV